MPGLMQRPVAAWGASRPDQPKRVPSAHARVRDTSRRAPPSAIPAQQRHQQAGATKQEADVPTVADAKRNGFENGFRLMDLRSHSLSVEREHDPSLADMVQQYLEGNSEMWHSELGRCGRARCNCRHANGDSSSENEDSRSLLISDETSDVILGSTSSNHFERGILAVITSALKARACGDEFSQEFSPIRWVLRALRASGFDAGICQSHWDHVGRLPKGEYEYIDIVMGGEAKGARIIVDINLQTQFEIARPTNLYTALVQSLPPIFVGKSDRLQQIVDIMCDAAKLSMRKRGLFLPPWRKPDYMRARWFSPYCRTTSIESTADTEIGPDLRKGLEKDCQVLRLPQSRSMKDGDYDPKYELEGQVRGGNFMGLMGLAVFDTVGDGDVTQRPRAVKWEPPPVIPKMPLQRAAAGKKGGLSKAREQQQTCAADAEANSPTQFKEGTREFQKEGIPQREKCA